MAAIRRALPGRPWRTEALSVAAFEHSRWRILGIEHTPQAATMRRLPLRPVQSRSPQASAASTLRYFFARAPHAANMERRQIVARPAIRS
jgi:hypothetical protein